MYKYSFFYSLVFVLFLVACGNQNRPKGVYYCMPTKDAAKYENTDCYWQKLDFKDDDSVIGTTKNGNEIKGKIAFDTENHLIVILSKEDPHINLILTPNKNTQVLEGRGYLFKK